MESDCRQSAFSFIANPLPNAATRTMNIRRSSRAISHIRNTGNLSRRNPAWIIVSRTVGMGFADYVMTSHVIKQVCKLFFLIEPSNEFYKQTDRCSLGLF